MSISNDVQRVYVAFFNRPADANGLQYWIDRIAANTASLTDIASRFAESREYRDLYAGSSPADVVTAVYKNLFGREPEAEGLVYWVDALSRGTADPGKLAYQVLNGARGSDRVIIDNKAVAAEIFTQSITDDAVYDASLVGSARSWLSAIDQRPLDTSAIKLSAVALIDAPSNDNGDDVVGSPPPVQYAFELGWNGTYVPGYHHHFSIAGFDPNKAAVKITARDGYDFKKPDIIHFSALGEMGGENMLDMAVLIMQGDRGDGTPLMAGESAVFTFRHNGAERTYLFIDDGDPAVEGWGNAVGSAVYNLDSDLLVDITGVTGLVVNDNAVGNLWLVA